MRLMAKFLMNLRELDCPSLGNEVQAQLLWDFLVPSKYDLVVAAAVQLAYPYMDDVDDLGSPSNAIKIKYDILKSSMKNGRGFRLEEIQTLKKLTNVIHF